MHWLISLAVFYLLNESSLSWKSSPLGQVSCNPRSPCFPLSPNSVPARRKQETAPSSEINTWYPIPKWKVFFDPHSRNRSQLSQPYFNKHDLRRTDGNIYDNDFSSPGTDLKKRADVFKGLNIQFLPLKDGNITVRGFGGKINNSVEEYVALFVVYAHSVSKNSQETQESNSDRKNLIREELEMEFTNRKENINDFCSDPGGCVKNDSIIPFFISNATDNRISSKGEKIISIPVTRNMSIEMKIGESDNDNYTVMIIPLDEMANMTNVECGGVNTNDEKLINIMLSKNMTMVIKSDELAYDKPKNTTERVKITLDRSTDELGINKEGFDKNDDSSEITFTNNENTSKQSFENNTEVFNDSIDSTISGNQDRSPSTVASIPTTFDSYLGLNESDNVTSRTKTEDINISLNDTGYNLYNVSKETSENYPAKHSKYINLSNASLDQSFDAESANYANRNENQYILDSYEIEYYKRFGPYEVKEINSSHSPFITTIHITVNNGSRLNKTIYMIHVSSQKINNSDNTAENSTSERSANKKENFSALNRRKRNSNNEYSSTQEELYQAVNNLKGKIINNKFVSHESKVSNKYPSRKTREILNKAKETDSVARTMNHFDLISPRDSRKEQSNFHRLFLSQKRPDSYSSATISGSNEEFNQKSTDKSRNKGFIANEILDNAVGDDGAKSNQIAYEVRNKREVALPTLIPNKDSGENHPVPKKSELQIVERGSLEMFSNGWKMKIPLGVRSLRRNDIKVGKTCHVEDEGKELSDDSNTMGKSENHKVGDVGKRSFDSNESLELNEAIDNGKRVYNRNFMQSTSSESMKLPVNNDGNGGKMKAKYILSSKDFGFGSSYMLNIRSQVMPTFMTTEAIAQFMLSDSRKYSDLNRTDSKTKSKSIIKKAKRLNNMTAAEIHGRHMYALQKQILNRQFQKDTNKTSKSSILKTIYELPTETDLLKKSSITYQNFPRKKRSNSGIIPLRDSTRSYQQRNLNLQSNQNFPQGTHSQVTNYSSNSHKSEKNPDEIQWLNFIHMLQTIPISSRENTRSPYSSHARSNNNIKGFGRGSIWQPGNSQSQWYADSEANKWKNGFSSDYQWFVLVPDMSEHSNAEPIKTKTQTPTTTDKVTKPWNFHSNPDREKEDFEWENNQWVLVDPLKEQKEPTDVSTKMPQTGQKPWDIINNPNQSSNSRTTNKPERKAVFRTTVKPTGKPDSRTTNTPRVPNFRTTPNPWSVVTPWEFNPWSISHNPWNNQLATPRMMMMGGMAGGD